MPMGKPDIHNALLRPSPQHKDFTLCWQNKSPNLESKSIQNPGLLNLKRSD